MAWNHWMTQWTASWKGAVGGAAVNLALPFDCLLGCVQGPAPCLFAAESSKRNLVLTDHSGDCRQQRALPLSPIPLPAGISGPISLGKPRGGTVS